LIIVKTFRIKKNRQKCLSPFAGFYILRKQFKHLYPMKKLVLFALLVLFISNMQTGAQGLKTFTLKNGLTVYIWEDATQSDVFGVVGVRAGAYDDPEQYTGLAHYLEHVLFKGTERIGALDWEKEKPIYEKIIAKYDEKAETDDPVAKAAIDDEINALTVEAGKISLSNEFTSLIDGIGATGLNAGTNFDYTLYYNTFPSHQINKWLEIYSERFINPVFRAFQTELESVYEEFNLYSDNPSWAISDFLLSKAFEGTPYGRPIIGYGEHLKNPRLSQLIKFYNEQYAPGNMVLILAGNINAQQISGKIASTFGRLEERPLPERKTLPDNPIKGRKQYTTKMHPIPSVFLIYNGVKVTDKDEQALNLCASLLSNSNRTGLLDKLAIDGDMNMGGGSHQALGQQGRFIIQAVPYYDSNQRRYQSNKSLEKMLLQAIDKLVNGEIEDWVFESVKMELYRDYDLAMESNATRGIVLFDFFTYGRDLNDLLQYKDIISAITVDDVKRVAKKYLSGDNCIVIYNERGKPDKKDKIKKPEYKPLDPPKGQSSLYAQQFKNIPPNRVEEKFFDFNDVKVKNLNEHSRLLYSENRENDLFMLTLKYGAGTETFPKLEYAAYLMNSAGVMGMYEPQELKNELARLGATCTISTGDSYLTVTVRGYEANLQAACQLVTRQILMPKLDGKQLNNVIGMEAGQRMSTKNNTGRLSEALRQYLVYKEKSDYISALTDRQLINLQISELTGDIVRASNYEAEIHYSGSMPFDDVYSILSTSLPLVEKEVKSESPVVREMATYKENTVLFLSNNDTRQSNIYFYIRMDNYNRDDDAMIQLFNQYFGSGRLGSLVFEEIREKNSMAYSSYGVIMRPPLTGKPLYYLGYIGTQNDKAVDAITLYTKLLTGMPEEKDRFENAKRSLEQALLASEPDARNKSFYYEQYRKLGYTQDPAKETVEKIKNITFEQFIKYYKDNIREKNIAIAVFGDPKDINLDALKQFGKFVRIDEKNLFNYKDKLF
jgi:predicted Zn-dependent peptidase